jgi:putative Mn2+ efflux pump MntP
VLLLLALVLPLGLDTFAVATALGAVGIARRRQLALSVLFAAFEGGMPLIGLLIGADLGERLGGLAEYLAIGALIAIGIYALVGSEEREESAVRSLARSHGAVLLIAGLAVSLDELAIGFAFGLLGVPIVPALLAIAAQAVIASQLGFLLGARIAERRRESVERFAGVALIAVALLLLASRV